jgi:hypothetical protein
LDALALHLVAHQVNADAAYQYHDQHHKAGEDCHHPAFVLGKECQIFFGVTASSAVFAWITSHIHSPFPSHVRSGVTTHCSRRALGILWQRIGAEMGQTKGKTTGFSCILGIFAGWEAGVVST